MSFFNKLLNLFSDECTDFADLSIGRVYIKPLTNGIINKVSNKSTVYNSVLNNSLYFSLMEYELVKLSKRKIDNLNLKDGNTLREKIKEILVRHNLITIEEVKPKQKEFSDEEIEMFKTQEKQLMEKLKTTLSVQNAKSSRNINK